MSVLAVVLQVVGALGAVVAAGMWFESVWPALVVAAFFAFLLGDALERR